MHGMIRIAGAAAAFALFVTGAGQASGAASHVIVVPRDYPTIQAAVDAAAPGDTINVRSGTYTEELVIGKDLTLGRRCRRDARQIAGGADAVRRHPGRHPTLRSFASRTVRTCGCRG